MRAAIQAAAAAEHCADPCCRSARQPLAALLSPADYASLQPYLEPVRLTYRRLLYQLLPLALDDV